jgi:uncharacterized protein (DUF697 family)
MTRKPLPRVIRRTPEELRRIALGASADDGIVTTPDLAGRQPVDAEPELPISSSPPANDTWSATAMRTAWFVAKRRSFARQIVDRHKAYAAVGGLAPVPIVNIAVLTAIIMRMVKRLSELYGVPYQRDRTRSAIIGLMAGAAPTGFGAMAASTLAFIVPGPGFVGLAVSAVTAGALTQGIGLIFVEHFETEAGTTGLAPSK